MLNESKNNPVCKSCEKVKKYSESLGRSFEGMPIEATDLAVKRRISRRRWSEREDEILKDSFMERTNVELAEELGRTPKAVSLRLTNLKLYRKYQPSRADKTASKREGSLAPADLPRPEKSLTTAPGKDFMIIDFSMYGDLFDRVVAVAAENFRTPELQVLYLCQQATREGSQR